MSMGVHVCVMSSSDTEEDNGVDNSNYHLLSTYHMPGTVQSAL